MDIIRPPPRDLDQNPKTTTAAALITELKRGREFAEQLQKHLNAVIVASDSDSLHGRTTADQLLGMIFTSYNKAISMICPRPPHQEGRETGTVKSPSSSRPRSSSAGKSGDGVRDWEDQMAPLNKKRKNMQLPRRGEYVKLSPEMAAGMDGGAHLDGYSWRKYGQKRIHGTTYARNYYRCTYLPTQSCLAKKQVQKSDEDPTLFHVVYFGDHTCQHHNQIINPSHTTIHQPSTPPPPPVAATADNSNITEMPLSDHSNTDKIIINPIETASTDIFLRSLSFTLSFSSLFQPESSVDLTGIFQSEDTPDGSSSGLMNPFATGSSSSTCNFDVGSRSAGSNVIVGASAASADLKQVLSPGPDSVTNSPIGDCFWSVDDFDFDVCLDDVPTT